MLEGNFRELRHDEVRKIFLPRTPVNRGEKGRSPKRWDSRPVSALWRIKQARSLSYAPG
jgi:hypothetical protein